MLGFDQSLLLKMARREIERILKGRLPIFNLIFLFDVLNFAATPFRSGTNSSLLNLPVIPIPVREGIEITVRF